MFTTDSEKIIYLDHAATTGVREEVLSKMLPYFTNSYGNPSSLYALAGEARNAIDKAREQVAQVIGSRTSEIVFTSGGTESDNMALKGAAMALHSQGKHMIISSIEHHAVIHPSEQLEKMGWQVTKLAVNKSGHINIRDLEEAVTEDTSIVSIILANNEIGSVQNLSEVSDTVHKKASEFGTSIVVHTDAVQAVGKLSVNVKSLGIDMMSLSGHKIHAPKGVGVLFVKRGTPLEPLLAGGGQERQRRSGTENVAGIVGIGEAIMHAEAEREAFCKHTASLRDNLIDQVSKRIPWSLVNGDPKSGLPHIANISFPGLEGEHILLGLDFEGICASSGSACSSTWVEPSHVLLALGMDADRAVSSVRFSLGKDTTQADIDYTVDKLESVINKLKNMPSLEMQTNSTSL